MTYDNIEIRDYLKNELPPDEVKKFEQLMNTDEAFAEEVKFQQLLLESMEAKSFMEVVKSVQNKTELDKKTTQDNSAPATKQTGRIAQRSILRWTSVAAAAVIAALFFFLWRDIGKTETDLLALADKYATSVQLPVDRSSDKPWLPTLLENELEIPLLDTDNSVKLNYSNPEAAKAEIANLKGEINPLRVLLLGNLYVKEKHPDKAHLYFDLLLDGRFTDFEPQARWQKALLLLSQDKGTEAKVLLKSLANLNRDTPIKKSAQALLKEL